ncbi:serine/threonine-protein phosphatase 1 regulatory subunit 10 isoform X2 [Culicoides brevitarsis]|uniref:serine/threonine-protein phosphatase 1 regulatory subunit 10 isoform X2 n=1 Tax=Culicoides brevitarsis TaxID=469753 RepID=UPI00307BD866
MPRIDPLKLLECLKVLLSPTGGIKSSTEVKRLANLMTKFSKKLVSKCIYIEILKCSDTDLLCQFMQAGGWTLVHLWLTDAMGTANWPLVHEILELLLLCPVDVERLKSNTAPKLVKQLTKDEHPAEVKVLAERLVQQWLRIVRGENAPSGNTSASDVASEIEDGSQDATEINQNGKEETTVAPVQEKIVLKLSVKDGKNVIIKKNDEPKDETDSSAGAEVTAVESTESSETNVTESEEKVSDETKTDETLEKKDEKKDKKKSSSKSSSSKSHHSSSSSHKSSSSSSSSKHKSSSSSSSSRDKDRHKSSSSHHKSSSKSSSSKSSSSRSEKKKDKEPEMSEADKVAKTLAELEPEKLTKLGKIPKKSSSSSSTDKPKPVSAAAAPAAPKVKPTFSIEERDPEKRSKTVKTLNSKFRSHGLEEEAPPPPSRKVLKKPSTPTTPTLLPPPVLTSGIKRVSPPKTTISKTATTDPALSPPAEKKPKIEETRINGLKKAKSHTLVETDLFSDALNMESTSRKRAIDAKKRKRRLSGSEATKTPASPTTPGIPMKFYQDTLTEEGDDKSKAKDKDNSPEKENEKDGENKTKKLRSSTSLEDAENDAETKKEETEVVEKRPPGIGTGPDGPPGILKVFNPNRKKRSIQWRAQEDLVEVRYFELDVEERCNVNRQFAECRQADMMCEREKILMARNLPKEDFMEAKTTWGQLIEVDDVPKHPNGEKSTERRTQAERERSVLPALWNRALQPNSPTEPDNEMHTYTEPKVIPIDDLTGNLEGVTDFSHMPWPEAKGETPTSNNNNTANLNSFASFNNQFGGAAPFAAPNIQQPPPVTGPWATAPPALLGALGQPPPFVDPHAINPLAAFNLPGSQFLPPGIIPPGIANNFVGPPPVNFPPTANRPPPIAPDRNNWVRGNADRNNRGRDNWNDRDRRGGNWDRDRGRGDARRDDRDRATRPGVCRQFVKYGNCRQGDRCIYSHPTR